MGDNEQPGPGAYLDQDEGRFKHKRTGNYSLAKRIKVQQDTNPGPGEYGTHMRGCIGQFKSQPVALKKGSFTTRRREQENPSPADKENPGPGAYNTEKLSTLSEGTVVKKAPQYKFGRQNRDKIPFLETNPGPGAYKVMSTFGH